MVNKKWNAYFVFKSLTNPAFSIFAEMDPIGMNEDSMIEQAFADASGIGSGSSQSVIDDSPEERLASSPSKAFYWAEFNFIIYYNSQAGIIPYWVKHEAEHLYLMVRNDFDGIKLSINYDPAAISIIWTMQLPELDHGLGPIAKEPAAYYRDFADLEGKIDIPAEEGYHFQPPVNWVRYKSDQAIVVKIPKLYMNSSVVTISLNQ